MAGDENLDETMAHSAPALFPVSSRLPSSSSSLIAPAFPSFPSAPSSVFPIVRNAGSQGEPSLQWLSNSSFSEVLLPPLPKPSNHPSDPTSSVEVVENEVRSSNDDAQVAGGVSSSDLDLSPDEFGERDGAERRREKKKRRKRRRREEERRVEKRKKKEAKADPDVKKIGALDGASVERKASVSAWADVNTSLPKEYYFDTHGDRENLAFGSLYRMDVARFRRQEMNVPFSELLGRSFVQRKKPLDFERDGVVQEEAVKTGGRYWSLKFASVERKRKLKCLRIGSHKPRKNLNKQKLAILGDFVPLEIDESSKEETDSLRTENWKEEKTWQEYVTLKTKEFNQFTREKPQDESLWIRFANFQDELIQATEKKSVIQQLVEKKIAILEKALDVHKDSEDLLILYLETCRRRDDASILLSKWEHAVSLHSGSFRMWREFIHFRCAQFSIFSVSSLRTLYKHALQALTAARNRLHPKGIEEEYYNEDFVEAEQAMVSIFIDLCRLNWQAGHHELAIGLFQAEIEYSLLAPPIHLSEKSKQRLFEAFWDSGGNRFGEDGALGWATWLEKEEEQIQKARQDKLFNDTQLEEEQAGGWTGWSAAGKELVESSGGPGLLEDESVSMDDVEMDADVVREEEDDAALLQKLGVSLDSLKEVEVKDTRIWKRWAEKEVERDKEQWVPVHSQLGKNTRDLEELDDGQDDQLERMVLFEDVKESLITLHSQQARLSLIYQFIDFCDGPLSQWCCSNMGSFILKMESLESLRGTLRIDMNGAKWHEDIVENSVTKLVGGPVWYQEWKGRAKFVRNCLSLVRSVFPHDRLLLNALLKAEDLATEETGSDNLNMASSRALAKKVLKIHRKDISMWGAYACIEAAAGNLAVARKVFDTTLASLGALPMEAQRDAPILYLAYAELELAQSSIETNATAEQKALYILWCLGCGNVYTPQSDHDGIPATSLLKCHLGFREHIQRVRRSDRGILTERGAALIGCAALFEQLTTGWEAAAAVFEEGLAITLPGKRQQSLESELLFLRYISMLEKFINAAKPARLRSTILRGFGQYPRNATLISSYIKSASQSAMGHKVRRFFDDASQRYPSPTLWLFALSCELWRPGAGPRIHSLFERALESKETQQSVLLWRCYLAYEVQVALNPDAARRVYFRAIHACPWSKTLWVDGFLMLSSVLTAKEQSEFVDVMHDKELRLRTDVYEILLEDEEDESML